MIHIFLTQPLKRNIEFDKLGITIRPLSDAEKKEIISRYDINFFSKDAKNKLKLYHKLKNNLLTFDERIKLDLNDDEYKAGYIYESLKLDGVAFNKRILNSQLNKICIVEFNNTINDYIEDGFEYSLFSNMLKTLLLIKKDYKLSVLKNMVLCNNEFDIFSDELFNSVDSVLNYISPKCPKVLDIANLDEKDFDKLNNFLTLLTKDRIRDFISIIENIFTKESSISNSLLTYISSLERLLVKYDEKNNYDIGKQVVLKFGLCISDNSDSDTDVQQQVNLIKYCYEVRSCIIHGNDKGVLNAPLKMLKMTKNDLVEIMGDDKTYKTRFLNIWFATTFLEEKIGYAIKEWIDNPSRIEFLKNN